MAAFRSFFFLSVKSMLSRHEGFGLLASVSKFPKRTTPSFDHRVHVPSKDATRRAFEFGMYCTLDIGAR
jgi:hypothetical protein